MVDVLKNKCTKSVSIAYYLPYLCGIGMLVFDSSFMSLIIVLINGLERVIN